MTLTQSGIHFTLKRKRFQKNTYIRVKSDGLVVVSTGYLTPKSFVLSFVEKKSAWIQKQQNNFSQKVPNAHYDKTYLKEKSQDTILPLVEKWSTIMMVSPTHIGFRYNRSRWGSCSGKNRLNFNTRLATMHPDFIEYVVVHELAHIRHKNHSKEFWAEVAQFLPDYKERQKLSIT
jgi:predicted metal-dependent hydrolase